MLTHISTFACPYRTSQHTWQAKELICQPAILCCDIFYWNILKNVKGEYRKADVIKKEQTRIDKEVKKLYKYAMYDGVVNEKIYCNASLKILWILKEVNDEDDYNQREVFDYKIKIETRGEGWWRTLDPIIYISYSLLNNFMNWEKMYYITEQPEMINILKQIAYINLNKETGGSVSNNNALRTAYNKYKEIIRLQINIANPDIIIGGNTLQFLYEDYGIQENQIKAVDGFDLGYYDTLDRLYINSYHPNYLMRINEDERGEYINAIIRTVKNWYKNNS